jgi:hypothetical protein
MSSWLELTQNTTTTTTTTTTKNHTAVWVFG